MGASDRGWEAAFAEADRYAERRARIEQVAEFARHLGRLDVRIDLLVDSDRRRALEAEREDQIIAIDAAIARALEP